MKSKCTLVVDGNWLLMSRISVLNNRYKNEYELCQDLKQLMLKSINVVLRQFSFIDNIIFVADGGSWRTDVNIPNFLEIDGIEYKGNRERSEGINWDIVFYEFENFMSVLHSTGITVSRARGLEGDDWCYHWSKLLNEDNTNCIIWSKDKDLTQLVKTNSDNCFTAWWNKDSGAYLQKINDEDIDFLFNSKTSDNEKIYREFISKAKSVNFINPKDIVIDKIIRGDLGDNIIPIIYKQSKTNPNKKFRVSQKDIDLTLDIHNKDEIRKWVNKTINSKSYLGKVDKSEDEIVDHFLYNVRLVELDEQNYPEEIKEIFSYFNEYNICKDVSEAQAQITANATGIQNILDFI